MKTEGNFFPKVQPEFHIQKQDILYIKIYTLNQEVSDLINQAAANKQQSLFQNETSLFINGYTVNDSGYVVGTVHDSSGYDTPFIYKNSMKYST